MDNPVAGAVHPVALAVPRPPPVWPAFHKTLATVTATVAGPPRKTAVTLRLAVWRRQPGGKAPQLHQVFMFIQCTVTGGGDTSHCMYTVAELDGRPDSRVITNSTL